MNKVILIGRLTKDVDIRYTEAGKAVANLHTSSRQTI